MHPAGIGVNNAEDKGRAQRECQHRKDVDQAADKTGLSPRAHDDHQNDSDNHHQVSDGTRIGVCDPISHVQRQKRQKEHQFIRNPRAINAPEDEQPEQDDRRHVCRKTESPGAAYVAILAVVYQIRDKTTERTHNRQKDYTADGDQVGLQDFTIGDADASEKKERHPLKHIILARAERLKHDEGGNNSNQKTEKHRSLRPFSDRKKQLN